MSALCLTGDGNCAHGRGKDDLGSKSVLVVELNTGRLVCTAPLLVTVVALDVSMVTTGCRSVVGDQAGTHRDRANEGDDTVDVSHNAAAVAGRKRIHRVLDSATITGAI